MPSLGVTDRFNEHHQKHKEQLYKNRYDSMHCEMQQLSKPFLNYFATTFPHDDWLLSWPTILTGWHTLTHYSNQLFFTDFIAASFRIGAS